jgi:hypothetical protein
MAKRAIQFLQNNASGLSPSHTTFGSMGSTRAATSKPFARNMSTRVTTFENIHLRKFAGKCKQTK